MEEKPGGIEVVVFDLNGTFYDKSSKDEFYKFICSKRPKRLKYLLQMGYYKLLLKVHQIRQTEFKENFFNYLDDFPPAMVEKYAREFWNREFPQNFNKELLSKFSEFKAKNIVVFCATGGLELYVKPLFDIYKIDGFAGTRVKYDGHTYLVQGEACKGEEKIKRLEKFLDGQSYRIIEAYSDSKEEILDRAEKAYLIKDGEITPY
ncbi:MAG TPA: HAD family hydrolase [Gillisia sp.]|nr:HAD family hydrolase [Gillisia sp.]